MGPDVAPDEKSSSSQYGRSAESRSYLFINRQRKHRINRNQIKDFLDRLTDHTAPGEEFSVVLVSDRTMQGFNRKFRGQDRATDVLAFPGDRGYLGDILISVETACEQSRKSTALTLEKNIRRLALHGLLHLMGYDHATDRGEMRALESRLRRRFQC